MTCAECFYFERERYSVRTVSESGAETIKKRETDYGDCRRWPPTVAVINAAWDMTFPTVAIDDWCGEFRERGIEATR